MSYYLEQNLEIKYLKEIEMQNLHIYLKENIYKINFWHMRKHMIIVRTISET